jgi:uncharacterized protein YjbI with pentapeptide repeats
VARFALAALAVLAGVALWVVPLLQVEVARERLAAESQLAPAVRLNLEYQLLQVENGTRATLAWIFAAVGLLLATAIIWRRFEISRELKTHERFARAVEQLASERGDGSPRTAMRLGGIYALERLALESDAEYWPVMQVLSAYVRENASWDPERAQASGPLRPPADVQAVLAVLGRRRVLPGAVHQRMLDLRETDLRGANLSGAHFEGVSLQGAHLGQADLTGAVLTRSNLRDAHLAAATMSASDLEGAAVARVNLEGARLNGANLKGADLSGANLRGADLWQANLSAAKLKDADLRGADLSQAYLDGAILWRADLQGAVMTGARLHETHLEKANLARASGLTWEQGEDAYTDENTVLPEYLLPREAAPSSGHNVVELQTPVRRPRAARPKPPDGTPKKPAVPKHRKPGLVKPA